MQLPFATRLLSLRPIVFVGLVSYSLYLWHWPIIAFYTHINTCYNTAVERVALVLASVALSVVSWQLVEIPFRRRDIIGSRALVLSLAAISISSMAARRFNDRGLARLSGSFRQ